MDDHQNEGSNEMAEAPEKKEKQKRIRFIGSFSHSLDAKGRLVIPQIFREKLGERFCVAPSYDFKSISVYPTEMWERRNEEYEKLGNLDPAVSFYLEEFYAMSYEDQACDGQGRVLLPANIRANILGEERDVEITGANDHIRVVASTVSRESWSRFTSELPKLLEKIAELERKANLET